LPEGVNPLREAGFTFIFTEQSFPRGGPWGPIFRKSTSEKRVKKAEKGRQKSVKRRLFSAFPDGSEQSFLTVFLFSGAGKLSD